MPKQEDKTFTPQKLEKQKQNIQRFINDVLEHPIIRTSNLFFNFISITSEKDYEGKKKGFIKVNPPNRVEEYHCLNGIARSDLTPELLQYEDSLTGGVENLKEYFKE